jgi:hypothetical protein
MVEQRPLLTHTHSQSSNAFGAISGKVTSEKHCQLTSFYFSLRPSPCGNFTQETNRKFRIRFLNSGELNADQVCSSCARQLSTFFEVRDADQEQQDLAAGRLPQRPPTPDPCITLQQITTSLMESQRNQGTNGKLHLNFKSIKLDESEYQPIFTLQN